MLTLYVENEVLFQFEESTERETVERFKQVMLPKFFNAIQRLDYSPEFIKMQETSDLTEDAETVQDLRDIGYDVRYTE